MVNAREIERKRRIDWIVEHIRKTGYRSYERLVSRAMNDFCVTRRCAREYIDSLANTRYFKIQGDFIYATVNEEKL